MKSVAVRMQRAKVEVATAVTQVMKNNELPAYIMEYIVSDVLCELRTIAKTELISEMEREHGDMEQGIQ